MLPNEIREFEEHFARCPKCAEMVAQVLATSPTSVVHQTEDGPVHLWATRDSADGWKARFWGEQLAGVRPFPTLAEANRYQRESFTQMFPHHTCSEGCGRLDDTEQARAADRMQFWDYSG